MNAALVCLILLAGDVSLNPGPLALVCRSQPPLDSLNFSDFKTIPTPGDGHCFLYAVRRSIAEYLKIHISHSELCRLINDEFCHNGNIYLSYFNGSPDDFYYQLSRYFRLKSYNSNVVDLLPAATANALHIRLIVITDYARTFNDCLSFQPHELDAAASYIVIKLQSEHYSATLCARTNLAGNSLFNVPLPCASMPVTDSPNAVSNSHNATSFAGIARLSITSLDAKDDASYPSAPSSYTDVSIPTNTSNLTILTATNKVALLDSCIASTPCFDGNWNFLPNDLTIMHCNCQGLLGNVKQLNFGYHNKIDYLRYLLQVPKAPPVVCLSETKLSSKILDCEINIPDYSLFRRDRNRNGGGVAIFCRSSFNPQLVADVNVSGIELVAIKIFPQRSRSMIIVCVYRPPSSSASWMISFAAVMSKISSLYSTIIMAGDFNIDLLQSSSFSDELSSDFDLHQHIRRPTRVTKKQQHAH
jgi:hypothetical protein